MQILGHSHPVAMVAQPGDEGLGEPLTRAAGEVVERREHLRPQEVQQSGIAVHDDRVEVVVDEDRVAGQDAVGPHPQGELGEFDTAGQGVDGHADAHDAVHAGQRRPQLLASAAGVRNDRADQCPLSQRQHRAVQPGEHVAGGRLVAADEDHRRLMRQSPAGPVGGGAHGSDAGALGEQQVGEVLAVTLTGP